MTIPGLLAQYSYSFQDWFVKPLPVWDYWYLLLLPLCLGVSIVWKSIKCGQMKQVPRESAVILFWIIVGMGAVAGVLGALVNVLQAAAR